FRAVIRAHLNWIHRVAHWSASQPICPCPEPGADLLISVSQRHLWPPAEHGSDATAGNGRTRMLLSTLALLASGVLAPWPAITIRLLVVAVSPATKHVGACLGSSPPSSGKLEPTSAFNCLQLLPSLEYQPTA